MIGPNTARCGAPIRARARLRSHHVFVDREIYCTLHDPANGDEYEVKLTVTGISGEMFEFDVEGADTPQ
ncbi:hypothetical protein GALLR39Z86_44510 [Glycomyces algeriensis]|uniref:Uncharacterized protein n=1 Tax=Glycomyces algeriensis TaxID=256037 RepID=A0A9W6GCN7_9ACTN|nr:hypothetical protein GALLR39Z86_44510 [Glycomyces algeriensis]